MNAALFLTELEGILEEQTTDNYPEDWDEDFITRSILKEMRNRLTPVTVFGLRQRMKIKWFAYKQAGTQERNFGDIALLVEIQYQGGDRVEGVAFFEAKKRSVNKTVFSEIRFPQLRRINRNATHSMVLLYDYEDITQFADFNARMGYPWSWFEWKACTYSVVVPISIVLNKNKKDTSLYKFSLPLSYQLFFRHFQGFDLEFQRKTIDIAKGYDKQKGTPKYLVIASIALGKAEPYTDISFNRDAFGELE